MLSLHTVTGLPCRENIGRSELLERLKTCAKIVVPVPKARREVCHSVAGPTRQPRHWHLRHLALLLLLTVVVAWDGGPEDTAAAYDVFHGFRCGGTGLQSILSAHSGDDAVSCAALCSETPDCSAYTARVQESLLCANDLDDSATAWNCTLLLSLDAPAAGAPAGTWAAHVCRKKFEGSSFLRFPSS